MADSKPRTLFEKIWDAHIVRPASADTPAILYVDLQLIHEVTSPQAFSILRERGLRVRRPDRTVATMDHSTPTTPSEKVPRVEERAGLQPADPLVATPASPASMPLGPQTMSLRSLSRAGGMRGGGASLSRAKIVRGMQIGHGNAAIARAAAALAREGDELGLVGRHREDAGRRGDLEQVAHVDAIEQPVRHRAARHALDGDPELVVDGGRRRHRVTPQQRFAVDDQTEGAELSRLVGEVVTQLAGHIEHQ